MNEKIKQLCEQAKAYANESTKDFTGDEPVVWMDYYTERFTKLIVKECAMIGELKEQGSNDYDHNISVGLYMRQHFGVE